MKDKNFLYLKEIYSEYEYISHKFFDNSKETSFYF